MAKVVVDGWLGNWNGFQDFVVEGKSLKDCASKLVEQTEGFCAGSHLQAFNEDGDDVSAVFSSMINLIDKE